MMVGDQLEVCKSGVRFASPPWDEHSPDRIQIGEQLGSDHVLWVIDEAVSKLDLSKLSESYSYVGSPPYPPELMLRMVLYEIRKGRNKPSQWFEDCRENLAMQWLGYGICPSRTCWYNFRDRIGPYLDELNQQVLGQAIEGKLTSARRAALDGSTIAANASRRRLINEDRLEKRIKQLEAARALDEKGESPEDVPGWMAKTPETRVLQQTRLEQARKRLRDLHEENERRIPSERKNRERIVVSTSDPEAATGLDKEHVFRPLYTAQTVRDLDSQFILGYDVFAQPTDADTLEPMIDRVVWFTGRPLQELLVDSGYVTGCDLAVSDAKDISLCGPWKENDYSTRTKVPLFSKDQFQWLPDLETYRCPAGHLLKRMGTEMRVRSGGRAESLIKYLCPVALCRACALREKCTTSQKSGRSIKRSEHEDLISAHRQKMATDEAKALYKLRGQSVELVYADLKEHRGLRRFSGRGLQRAHTEFALQVLTHNLLLLHQSLNRGENESTIDANPQTIAA